MPLIYRTASSTCQSVAPKLPPTVCNHQSAGFSASIFHTLNWQFSRVCKVQDVGFKAAPVWC